MAECTLRGHFLAFAGPNATALPEDFTPLAGDGTITANAAAAIGDGTVHLPGPINVTVDDEGYLCDPYGGRDVALFVGDSTTNPEAWNYTIRLRLAPVTGGAWRDFTATFDAASGETIDLADVASVPADGGVWVVKIVSNGLSIGTIETLAPGSAVTASITGPVDDQKLNLGIPSGAASDSDVASAISTDGNLSNTAVESIIDGRVDDRNDVLLKTASKTRAGVDARVTALADGAVSGKIADTSSSTRAGINSLVDGRPVHASGNDSVDIGLVRKQLATARYSAFPIVTKLLDERLFMVWYEATDHITTRDGIVVGAYSADNGKTWGPRFTVQAQTGIDLRDPTVSTTADRKNLFLTYIKCTAAKPRDGFFLRKSTDNGATWGPEVRIDPVGSNGAGTGPIVQLANGKLFATWFGMLNGESRDSSYYATSSDNGATWSAPVKFRNGQTDGRDYNEPYAAVFGSTVVVLFRWGMNDGIGVTRSTDNGVTWSAPARAFDGSGRPGFVITANGTIVVVYRNNDSPAPVNQHGMMRTSRDLGSSWTRARLVEPAVGGWWVYSGLYEVVPGQVVTASAVELSTTSTEISVRYLTEGSGASPYGDVPPTALERATTTRNHLAAVDTFDRPNASSLGRTENGEPWLTTNGSVSIVDGALQSVSGSVSTSTVNVRTPNLDISAEFSWSSSAGVYLIFRMVDQSNYWMFGPESNGTVLRLYKVINGAATQEESVAVTWPAGVIHKLKVVNTAGVTRCYFEDEQMFAHVDNGAPNGLRAGIRVGNVDPAAVHRAQNVVIHRRSGFEN